MMIIQEQESKRAREQESKREREREIERRVSCIYKDGFG